MGNQVSFACFRVRRCGHIYRFERRTPMSIDSEMMGDVVIYQSEDGLTHIAVKMVDETAWLTQQQLVDLYQTSKANVSEHIKHIFEEGELAEKSVVRKFRTTASDGKNYNVTYYNLDLIITLGYRIKSSVATKFRRWATEHLKEYLLHVLTFVYHSYFMYSTLHFCADR